MGEAQFYLLPFDDNAQSFDLFLDDFTDVKGGAFQIMRPLFQLGEGEILGNDMLQPTNLVGYYLQIILLFLLQRGPPFRPAT